MTTKAPGALYGIYNQIKPHLTSMRIGGVVGDAAHSSGYHVSRADLLRRGRSGDYSIQAPADKRGGASYASAIDITLSPAEMVTVSKRLRAAMTPDSQGEYDPRIEPVREFIGTVDGRSVCGYNRYKTGRRTGWYPSGYSDASHLWHVHISVFRDYCDDKARMTGLAEVIAGLPPGGLGWVNPDLEDKPEPNPAPKPTPPAVAEPEPEPAPVEPKPVEPKPTGVNVRVGTWNTRRSSYAADTGVREWSHRDDLAREFLLNIPGGAPGILLGQETTATQGRDIGRMLGYTDVGNGRNGHPRDRAGDNVVAWVDTADYKILRRLSVPSGGAKPRYLTLVEVERKGATAWFGSCHLTSGSGNAALRQKEMRALLTGAKAKGVDMARLVIGSDLNEATAMGARKVARDFGLTDIRDLLDDTQFTGDKLNTFTGWDHDVETGGRHIDAILVGAEIRVRAGSVVPVTNGASDHHLVMANLTLPLGGS